MSSSGLLMAGSTEIPGKTRFTFGRSIRFDRRITEEIEVNGDSMSDLERERRPAGQIKIVERGEKGKELKSGFSERLSVHGAKWGWRRGAMQERGSLA